ncbi:mechanosensitive ion channel domain-containing protein [Pleomorphovibrio marinus]|uniref:mechanosensitive ion channel domain-containing protein n=1 Tax=Pleomorphovibrio marinus TaxID=2164132 RepID=UPI000E0C8B3F|nr:mechanosensitive ion channel domain-containing protein [Pleomorphovibrio marinus]
MCNFLSKLDFITTLNTDFSIKKQDVFCESNVDRIAWGILVSFLLSLQVYAPALGFSMVQQDPAILADTLTPDLETPISLEKNLQNNQQVLLKLQQALLRLQRRPNMAFMEEEVPVISRVLDRIQESFYTHDQVLNFQYLNELDNLVVGYQTRLGRWQSEVQSNLNQYLEIAEEIEPVLSYSNQIRAFSDSLNIPSLSKQIEILEERVSAVDSLLRIRRLEGVGAQSELTNLIISLNDLKEELRERQVVFRNRLFYRDSPPIWQSQMESFTRDFRSIVAESLLLNEVILISYLKKNTLNLFFLVVLILVLYRWYVLLLKKIGREKEFSSIILKRTKYLSFSPFICALLSGATLGPYFFAYPPNTLILIFLLTMAGCTTFLIRHVVTKKAFRVWGFMMLSLLVYGFSNLVTEWAIQEKVYLMMFSLLGVLIGAWTLRLIQKDPETFPMYLSWLVYLFVSLQVLAVFSHAFGRFSLGKLLGVTATLNLMQAISLYVFVLVVMEVVYLFSELSKKSEAAYTSFVDYAVIFNKLKKLLISLAVIMWAYYFTTNLYVDQFLWESFSGFLNQTRTLGNNSFTYGSILIFLVVLWISSLLAKNIAYFVSVRDAQNVGTRDKKIGSSILLIRLGILSLGFLFAISLSGISLDRLAIVIGALTVGIGFGLQNIVNNLASGIILAFERPVQVGDAIEVGNQLGIVKDIGIRSSTIQAYDGSEVIIPNGDLISNQLVNWTLSNRQRRVEIFVGVAYGSDIVKVQEVLTNLINEEQILRHPPPKVLMHNFADSSVEFRLLFWVDNVSVWLDVKHTILHKIYQAFYENGIKIPFPQRDIHLGDGWHNFKGSGDGKSEDPGENTLKK